MRILGVSGSLRNARFGAGSEQLITELKQLQDVQELQAYLESQTRIRLEDFEEAGRKEKLDFTTIYRNLQRAKGDRGLSNSEAALAAGLWGAWRESVDIEHCGLSKHFPMNGEAVDLDGLRSAVLSADAILVSGPVYFGDRGSPIQEFFEFLRRDRECARHVQGRPFAGIAVGAKRNGGQETTLIYQMIDAANLKMLVVGNDGKSTAQYGGTNRAGDIGTLHKDNYGIETSIATGRRLARTMQMVYGAENLELMDPVRIGVWSLQDDAAGTGLKRIESLVNSIDVKGVDFSVRDFSKETIYRCIACDVCPIDIGPVEEYRCIIKSKDDLFAAMHAEIVGVDAIILAGYSPKDRADIFSVYQRFIERTRYLRRDDYVFSDFLVTPLIFSEIGSNQNLHIRMMTSLIRHQTVVHQPLLGFEHEGSVLNQDELQSGLGNFAQYAKKLTAYRAARETLDATDLEYNPIGYQISAAKKAADQQSNASEQVRIARKSAHELSRARVRKIEQAG